VLLWFSERQNRSRSAPSRNRISGTDEVAALVQVTGTHAGDLGFPDGDFLPPTGASIDVELVEFWRFEGDRVAEYKVIYDQAGVLAQLGVGV
jgi:predicted ester cyclase